MTLIITTTSLAKGKEGWDQFKSQFDFLIAQSQIRSLAEQSEDPLTPDVISIQPEILKYFEFFNPINLWQIYKQQPLYILTPGKYDQFI